ncbi:hypothetical protein ACFSKY_22430 [Azotobacter chroococcum]|uniref:Uncharacterized protein n=1 Tax=Azotobacter chroococcum TaxID=353 RepID=A0A4V2Q5A4_9GAMM|nr:hypothetical protein [Azotobacter chroococcum]TBV93949.1 hypothetical protein E0E53_15815 [Azotobacter chroococcum]TCL18578.1 hypothetical protein EV691_1464 [Azotobacter chroococcum]
MTHYPKGGRCRHCTKLHDNCSGLPFETMPVHRHDGADVVVICTEYQQINRNATMKADRRRRA